MPSASRKIEKIDKIFSVRTSAWRSVRKQKKKKAEPHFDQQSVYQEPGYHDFPDDFSADNYSDHTDMVPLDKDSIMS